MIEVPIESNIQWERMKRIWRMVEDTAEHREVSGGKTVPQRGQNPPLAGVCYRREKRESTTIGEASETVRGLIRVQYPSRVNGRGYGGWLKAFAGTKRTVEVKWTPQKGQNRPSERVF